MRQRGRGVGGVGRSGGGIVVCVISGEGGDELCVCVCVCVCVSTARGPLPGAPPSAGGGPHRRHLEGCGLF